MEDLAEHMPDTEVKQNQTHLGKIEVIEGSAISDMGSFTVNRLILPPSEQPVVFADTLDYSKGPIKLGMTALPETQFGILDFLRSNVGGRWFFDKQVGDSNMHSFSTMLDQNFEATTKGIATLRKIDAVNTLHAGSQKAQKVVDIRLTKKGWDYHQGLQEKFPDAIQMLHGSKKIIGLQHEINHARAELGKKTLQIIQFEFSSLEDQIKLANKFYADLFQLEKQIDQRNPKLASAA